MQQKSYIRKGGIAMPSNKPRIATYTTQNNIDKFKVISAINGMSMSEYLAFLIEKTITDYETENDIIIVKKKSPEESED